VEKTHSSAGSNQDFDLKPMGILNVSESCTLIYVTTYSFRPGHLILQTFNNPLLSKSPFLVKKLQQLPD